MYLPKFRYILWSKYFVVSWLGETIDTDQSVALMVAKVTIDTDRWKVRNGSVYLHRQWLRDDIKFLACAAKSYYLFGVCHFGCAVYNCMDYGREEETVGK